MNRTLHFQANAGLKDIVGRGLIYNDNVAILELVKNAKDASSDKVEIFFSGQTNDERSLLIKDYGQGMSLDDIEKKWLNIAYSEKRGNKLKSGQYYAGNKGVGRFSCDRLGSELTLFTKSKTGDFLKIFIDWALFERNDPNEKISDIPIDYEVLQQTDFINQAGLDSTFSTGTVLKIDKLRNRWNENKLNKLIPELEKFSPGLDKGFEVYIFSDEKYRDEGLNKKLNKKIANNILDEISFKTTHIESEIDKLGEKIYTKLFYHDALIYEYTANNPYQMLKNITVEIHFLDSIAKSFFTKKFGTKANEYGSVFLFHNGFRVSPYGNFKNDWLSLDQRKSQGTSRYLGTRDVIGKITIDEDNDTFNIVSSREGMAQDIAFNELVAFDQADKATLKNGKQSYGYVTTLIRQLESFVVGGLEWNRIIDTVDTQSTRVITSDDILRDHKRYKLKALVPSKLEEAAKKILRSDFEIIDVNINTNKIKTINKDKDTKFEEFVANFVEKSGDKNLSQLTNVEKIKVRKILETEREKTAVETQGREKAEKEIIKKDIDIDTLQGENLFLRADSNQDSAHLLDLHHLIISHATTVETRINLISTQIARDGNYDKDKIQDSIQKALFSLQKIRRIANAATKQNYKLAIKAHEGDLNYFISNYLKEESTYGLDENEIKIVNNIVLENKFISVFTPLEIMTLVDNMISNSIRAGAHEIVFGRLARKNGLFCIFDDANSNLDHIKNNPDRIFDKGYTTTEGSGRGLDHVKKTLNKLGLDIEVNKEKLKINKLYFEVFKKNDN